MKEFLKYEFDIRNYSIITTKQKIVRMYNN